MTPKPLTDLRRHIEQTQAEYEDPAERDRALGVIEGELTDLLGITRTYRNDAQRQTQGANAERDQGEGDAEETATPSKTSDAV